MWEFLDEFLKEYFKVLLKHSKKYLKRDECLEELLEIIGDIPRRSFEIFETLGLRVFIGKETLGKIPEADYRGITDRILQGISEIILEETFEVLERFS